MEQEYHKLENHNHITDNHTKSAIVILNQMILGLNLQNEFGRSDDAITIKTIIRFLSLQDVPLKDLYSRKTCHY